MPRHPERFMDIENLLVKNKVAYQKKTDNKPIDSATEVFLGDTMGEMMLYYKMGDLAVIGGSFSNNGGQNLLEPIYLDKPVIFGSSMYNFTTIAYNALNEKCAIQVNNIEECFKKIEEVFSNQEQYDYLVSNCRIFIDKYSGASEKIVEDISRYLIDTKDIPETQASRIAYLSNGNLQAALNHLKEDDHDDFRNFTSWMRMTFADKGAQIIDFVDMLSKLGRENQKNMLRYGVQLIRECIMMVSGAESLVHLPSMEHDFVKNFSNHLDFATCEALINELEKAHYHIERNANPKILFLDVSLQFVKILKFNTLPAGTQYILN